MFSQINPQLIHNLEKLGLTENEAKAYVGLVSLGEATAREIHDLTNVPRAKVYEILKMLAKKGYLEVRQGSPTYFRAVDPKKVIGEIREEFLNCAIETLDQLNELSYELPKTSPVWYIQSDWGMKNRIREIMGAKRAIPIKSKRDIRAKSISFLWYNFFAISPPQISNVKIFSFFNLSTKTLSIVVSPVSYPWVKTRIEHIYKKIHKKIHSNNSKYTSLHHRQIPC